MVVCNKCSKEVGDGLFDINLYHQFKTTFHYGSAHDLEEWKFTLCEDCLLEFVGTFQIKPSVRKYTFDEESGMVGKEIWPMFSEVEGEDE